MNLIERYVTEVGKHLPRKTRADIETELRSTLEDMLEDRSQQANRPADDTMLKELLQEYGAPKDVAQSYHPTQYLIGPRLFPTFKLVLTIVIAALLLGLSVSTIVSLFQGGMTSQAVLEALGRLVLNLFSGLIQAFGNVVLIFAILERVLPSSEIENEFGEKEEWTPAALTKTPDPAEVKIGEMIASIVFTVAALVILNFYPQIIGIWMIENGEWVQMAELSEAFFQYLPFININGLLTIALNLYLMRRGLWQTLTRWLYIGTEIISVAIAVAMLRGPALMKYYPSGSAIEVTGVLSRVFEQIIPLVLLIVIVVGIIEIGKTLYRLGLPVVVTIPLKKK